MCLWLGKHRRMIINIFNSCWLAGLEILYGLVWILMNSKNFLPRSMEYLDRLQKEVFWIFGKPPKKFFCCACQHIHLTFSDRCIFVKNILKFPKTSKVKLYQNSFLLRLSISCALRELCALHAVNISGKDPPTSLQSPLSKIQTKPLYISTEGPATHFWDWAKPNIYTILYSTQMNYWWTYGENLGGPCSYGRVVKGS